MWLYLFNGAAKRDQRRQLLLQFLVTRHIVILDLGVTPLWVGALFALGLCRLQQLGRAVRLDLSHIRNSQFDAGRLNCGLRRSGESFLVNRAIDVLQ